MVKKGTSITALICGLVHVCLVSVDFGLSFIFRHTDFTSRELGNNKFSPPEVLNGLVSSWSGRAADMWSVGITLFLMKFGELPFG